MREMLLMQYKPSVMHKKVVHNQLKPTWQVMLHAVKFVIHYSHERWTNGIIKQKIAMQLDYYTVCNYYFFFQDLDMETITMNRIFSSSSSKENTSVN